MAFDTDLIPDREWIYRDNDHETLGISLSAEGVVFWAKIPSDEMFGGGSYRAGFAEFLRSVRKKDPRHGDIPADILDEVYQIVLRAQR